MRTPDNVRVGQLCDPSGLGNHQSNLRELRQRKFQHNGERRELPCVDKLLGGSVRKYARDHRERSSVRVMPKRDVHEQRESKHVYSARCLRRGYGANGARDANESSNVRCVPRRDLLSWRYNGKDIVRCNKLGPRPKLGHVMCCAYPVCGGAVRHERRFDDDQPHVRTVRAWLVQHRGKRLGVCRLEQLRAGVLREHGWHEHQRSKLYGVRERHVHERRERECVFVRGKLLRRFRANGGGDLDKPDPVRGLPGWHLLCRG